MSQLPRFTPVDTQVSFPDLESAILDFWDEAQIFAKSLELRADAPEWVFYEGPPTANGRPGLANMGPTFDPARTQAIAKGVCAAAIGNGAALVQ